MSILLTAQRSALSILGYHETGNNMKERHRFIPVNCVCRKSIQLVLVLKKYAVNKEHQTPAIPSIVVHTQQQ